MLQVWDMSGKRRYEKVLQAEPSLWGVYYDHFLFRTAPEEEDSGYFQIVNIAKNSNLMVQDTFNEPNI